MRELPVPRVISFLVLLAIALLVGAVFFQVMAQFFVPLFLACVLLVVFEPLHRWIVDRMPGYRRLGAFLTTIAIILVVVLPLVWLGWKAYVDFHALLVGPGLQAAAEQQPQETPAPPAKHTASATAPAGNADAAASEEIEQGELNDKMDQFAKKLIVPVADMVHVKVPDVTIKQFVAWVSGFTAKLVVTGVQSIIGIIIGLFILVIALFFFLADGPAMIEAVMAISPLDRSYEQELLQRFADVSRAVVVATLVAAVAQGGLAGIGYNYALPPGAPVFLLTAITTVFALIPIFGAFGIWGIVCIWIYVQGHTVAALSLAIYCTIVVSIIDNIMKPLILHGQSKLHPLLALLSILGGIHAFGPVGILVGPMLVSFLQALLNMLRKELDSFEAAGASAKPLAETVADAFHLNTPENAAPVVQSAGHGLANSADGGSKDAKRSAKLAGSRRSKRKQ